MTLPFISDEAHAPSDGRGTLFGVIVNVLPFKRTSILWCWSEPGLAQVIMPRSRGRCPRPGMVVRFSGRWQSYRGSRPGFLPRELLVEETLIVAEPANPDAWRHRAIAADSWKRLRRLALRSRMIGAALAHLDILGFVPVCSPALVGNEACSGPTAQFRVTAGGEQALLTVNTLWSHIEQHGRGVAAAYQIANLYWAQRYNNRFSLNEISLLELSAIGRSAQAMMSVVESTLAAMAESVRAVPVGLSDNPTPPGRAFTNLPRVTFDDAVDFARREGLLQCATGHVLPAALNARLAARLGAHAFWITDAPEEASPFYSRVRRRHDGSRRAASFELRTARVPNAAAGSEWMAGTDAELGRVPVPFRGLFDEKLASGSAVSIGLDRVAMDLLCADHIREVVPEVRDARKFRSTSRTSPSRARRLRLSTLASSGLEIAPQARGMGDIVVGLLEQGYLPATAGLIADPKEPSGQALACIDYFGRAIALRTTFRPALSRLIEAGVSRVFRLGPADPGSAWWQLQPVLDLLRVECSPAALREEALRVLRLVTACPGVSREFATGVRHIGPDSLAYASDGSFAWSWGERSIIVGALWSQQPGGVPIGEIRIFLGRIPNFVWGIDDRVREEESETTAAPKRWRCAVCGYIHEGPAPPSECPVCGAGCDRFVPFEP